MMIDKEKFDDYLSTVWRSGTYLATKADGRNVYNTYFINGFFVDLVYNVDAGKIIEIYLDDNFSLNMSYIMQVNGYKTNLN